MWSSDENEPARAAVRLQRRSDAVRSALGLCSPDRIARNVSVSPLRSHVRHREHSALKLRAVWSNAGEDAQRWLQVLSEEGGLELKDAMSSHRGRVVSSASSPELGDQALTCFEGRR